MNPDQLRRSARIARTLAVCAAALAMPACDPTGPDRDPAAPVSDVVSGRGFSCALADGTAYCWGLNDAGQLGRGDTSAIELPAPVAGGHDFQQIAAGHRNVCGIAADGVYCWGGAGLFADDEAKPLPERIPLTSASVQEVGVGISHACARLAGGEAWCWGGNQSGQHGDGTAIDTRAPTQVAGGHTFTELSVGAIHSCGRAGAEVWCWGLNYGYVLGAGTSLNRAYVEPEPAPIEFAAVSVLAGAGITCVVDADGGAWCWGVNGVGQLGRGEPGDASGDPAPVAIPAPLDRVFNGALNSIISHACALAPDGAAWCWGAAANGRLGREVTGFCSASTGPTVCDPHPAAVAMDLRFLAIAPGLEHTCAVTTDRVVYCWGRNEFGEHGDGQGATSPEPVRVVLNR